MDVAVHETLLPVGGCPEVRRVQAAQATLPHILVSAGAVSVVGDTLLVLVTGNRAGTGLLPLLVSPPSTECFTVVDEEVIVQAEPLTVVAPVDTTQLEHLLHVKGPEAGEFLSLGPEVELPPVLMVAKCELDLPRVGCVNEFGHPCDTNIKVFLQRHLPHYLQPTWVVLRDGGHVEDVPIEHEDVRLEVLEELRHQYLSVLVLIGVVDITKANKALSYHQWGPAAQLLRAVLRLPTRGRRQRHRWQGHR